MMAKAIIEFEGKKYNVEGTLEQIEAAATQITSAKPENPAVTTAKKIEGREAQKFNLNPADNIFNPFNENPVQDFQTAVGAGLQNLGAASQRFEAALSNPSITVQQGGSPLDVLKSGVQGLTGEKTGQIGDVARNVGAPEGIAATFGFVTDMALGMQIAKLAQGTKALSQSAKSGRLAKIAEEQNRLSAQILQPGTKDLQNALSKNKILPSMKAFQQLAKKSKNFDDLKNIFSEEIENVFTERNTILNKFNAPVDTNKILDNIAEFAQKEAKKFTRSKTELRAMNKWIDLELEYLAKNPKIDILTSQARKELLQDSTAKFIDKKIAGTLMGEESVELFIKDAIRDAYKDAIERSLPAGQRTIVKNINSQYEGLKDARDLLSKRQASDLKKIPDGIVKKFTNLIGINFKLAAARSISNSDVFNSLSKLTGRVEKLRRFGSKVNAGQDVNLNALAGLTQTAGNATAAGVASGSKQLNR